MQARAHQMAWRNKRDMQPLGSDCVSRGVPWTCVNHNTGDHPGCTLLQRCESTWHGWHPGGKSDICWLQQCLAHSAKRAPLTMPSAVSSAGSTPQVNYCGRCLVTMQGYQRGGIHNKAAACPVRSLHDPHADARLHEHPLPMYKQARGTRSDASILDLIRMTAKVPG